MTPSYDVPSWNSAALHDAGQDARARLAPLLDRLRRVDELRVRLEREGGGAAELAALTELLNGMFLLETPYGLTSSCRLTQPSRLRAFVREVTGWTARLDVRVLRSGLPAYYVFRCMEDVYGEFALVVEDLYVSPGYPLDDERFVRVRTRGCDEYWLRLSPLRAGAAALRGDDDPAAVDARLHRAGRWVLAAAWHESQRPAQLVARCFGLTGFFRAVECLHLALTSDPCELRACVDEDLLRFFSQVYEHPSMRAWLASLRERNGAQLDRIWRDALALYRVLGADFARFLATEVPFGGAGDPAPLWKIVLANYHRMDRVAHPLRDEPAVRAASEILERAAEAVVERLVSPSAAA